MKRVINTRMMPMVKVAALGVPVMPWAPFIITSPPSSKFREEASFKEKWIPLLSIPTNRALIRFLIISPKARVTIAR